MGRATLEPGWKWSDCVKPIAGTDSCETLHTGYGNEAYVGLDFTGAADYAKG